MLKIKAPGHSNCLLKATRGVGSIIDFSAHFNEAVLLSYAFTLDPYNPIVLYPTGPLKFPSWVKSGLSVTFWQCIIKHSFITLFSLPRSRRARFSQCCSINRDPTQQTLTRDQYLQYISWPYFSILIFFQKYSIFGKNFLKKY